jgi:uncharacterized protein (DUF2336 family)
MTAAEFHAWFEARHARYVAELDAEVSRHLAEERRIERGYRRDLERMTNPMMEAAIVEARALEAMREMGEAIIDVTHSSSSAVLLADPQPNGAG